MSLLEDIFLQDEANEAQELERIIDGEEFEERPRSDSDDNSEKEDEAVEDKRKVEPNTAKAKRIIKNPRSVLNPARLTGPRGIQVIPEHFKDFKFKGKGHEKEDLDLILKRLEHWAYRLYPKFQFEDCLKKVETLGKKRPVMVHLHKIRSDQFVSEETVVQKDSSDDDTPAVQHEEDEFDRLLQQQIDLARSTPAPYSVKKPPPSNDSPLENRFTNIPKATSSPSISEEQRERMLRSRRLAEERRLARLKNVSIESNENTSINLSSGANHNMENKIGDSEIGKVKRHNKSNVIDSSDDEDSAVTYVNESITVDVHSNNKQGFYSRNDRNNDGSKPSIDEDNVIQQASEDNPDSNVSDKLELEGNTMTREATTEADFNIKDHEAIRHTDITIHKVPEANTCVDSNMEKQPVVTTEADNIGKDLEVIIVPAAADIDKEKRDVTMTTAESDNTEKDFEKISETDNTDDREQHSVVEKSDLNKENEKEFANNPDVDEVMDIDFSQEF